MQIWTRQFNLYLATVLALSLLCGCKTDKKEKNVSALRVHIEVPRMTATSQTITVLRSMPVRVTIGKDPILSEANIMAARIIDTHGGFAVQIKFNDNNGSWILQQYSAANSGNHFAIYGQWGDKLVNGRWLAAPLITHRISDGILTFTADASRQEMDELVLGLNNVTKKTDKGKLK